MPKTATTISPRNLNASKSLSAFRRLDFSKSALKVFLVLQSHLISDNLTSQAFFPPPLCFSRCLLKPQCQNAIQYENSFLLDGPIPAYHRSLPIYIFKAAALLCLSPQVLFGTSLVKAVSCCYFLPPDVSQHFWARRHPFTEMAEHLKASVY